MSNNLPPKNLSKKVDLFSWLFMIAFVVGTPFLVKLINPDAGKDAYHFNPTVLIIFLGFMALITLANLPVLYHWIKGNNKPDLSAGLVNWVNFQSKMIGGLFIVSGFVKLQDIVGFSYKLDEYWAVFGTDFMMPLSLYFAFFVSVFEVAVAFAVMTGYKMRISGFLLLGMILFFTFLTGFSAITGSVTDCGCFGDALKLTPWQTFTKDIFLTIGILPLFLLRKRIGPLYRKPIPPVATYGSFIIFGIISWYSYMHLPPLDFRTPYKVGQDLEFNATNLAEDGNFIAHDFFEFCSECGVGNGYEGATLYIVAYNLDKHDDETALTALRDLTNEIKAKAPGIKICGGSNTGSKAKKAIQEKYGLDMCFSGQDEKTLKTIVRSSPGYMLMKDGIILKKWHYHDTPTVEELRGLVPEYADQVPPSPEPEPAPVPDSLATDSLSADSMAGDSMM